MEKTENVFGSLNEKIKKRLWIQNRSIKNSKNLFRLETQKIFREIF